MRIANIFTAALVFHLTSRLPALAWGNEGHEIVALIAQPYLDPDVASQMKNLLNSDPTHLVEHDIAHEATWADVYRNENIDGARTRTSEWHYSDIEIDNPNVDQACFQHPTVPDGILTSNGPAHDCAIDKIEEFAAELKNPAIDLEERVEALEFVLHLVGDLHQPLHSADNNDRGGNTKTIHYISFRSRNLHAAWDTDFVRRLGSNEKTIAASLIAKITSEDRLHWSKGTPTDWAMEAFQLARDDAYGLLPEPNEDGTYELTDAYVQKATEDVDLQLRKAGVRLAKILNENLK